MRQVIIKGQLARTSPGLLSSAQAAVAKLEQQAVFHENTARAIREELRDFRLWAKGEQPRH